VVGRSPVFLRSAAAETRAQSAAEGSACQTLSG